MVFFSKFNYKQLKLILDLLIKGNKRGFYEKKQGSADAHDKCVLAVDSDCLAAVVSLIFLAAHSCTFLIK